MSRAKNILELWRTENKLSRNDLANKAGIPAHVVRYMEAQWQPAMVLNLDKLCTALGHTINEYVELNKSERAPKSDESEVKGDVNAGDTPQVASAPNVTDAPDSAEPILGKPPEVAQGTAAEPEMEKTPEPVLQSVMVEAIKASVCPCTTSEHENPHCSHHNPSSPQPDLLPWE